MVGLNSAIRGYRQDLKLPAQNPSEITAPHFDSELFIPKLDHFSESFIDPFPDFDVIKEWILEPDCSGMQNEEIQPENGETLPDSIRFDGDFSGFSGESVGDRSEAVRRVEEDLGKVSLMGGFETVVLDKSLGTNNDRSMTEGFDVGNGGLEEKSVALGVGNGDKVDGLADSSFVAKISGDFSKKTPMEDSVNGEKLYGCSAKGMGEEIDSDLAQSRNGASKDSLVNDLEQKPIRESYTESHENEIVSTRNKGNKDSESKSDDSSPSSSEEEEEDDDEDDDDDEEEEEKEEEEKEEEKEEQRTSRVEEFEEGEIRDLDVEKSAEMIDSGDDDEVMKGPLKSKNEIEVLPPVPPVEVALESRHQTLPVGVVLSIMGSKVIVEGLEKHNPLNEGSILWVTETRLPLGFIDEIFGPVKNPYYVVRHNSDEEVPAGICPGMAVSFVEQFASHILNDKNLYKKGYDASGENDEEVSDEAEFSDDDKEAEYRRSLRMAKRGMDDQKNMKQEFVDRRIGNREFIDRRSGNREFVGRKNGNRQFVDRKRAESESSVLQNSTGGRPPFPPATGPPAPAVGGPSHVHPNPFQMPPVAGQLGCANCACSVGIGMAGTTNAPFPNASPQPGYYAGPPQQVLMVGPNAVWPSGMPYQQQPQQQHMALPSGIPCQQHQHMGLPGGVHTIAMPCQQQQHIGLPSGVHANGPPDHHHANHLHQHQQQQQVFATSGGIWTGGLPCQHQFDPCQRPPDAVWTSGPPPNLGTGPAYPPLQGFVGQASFIQAPFRMSLPGNPHFGQFPPTAGGNFTAPQQFNPGTSSGHRGRPFPHGGRFSSRKGGRQPR